MVNLKLHAARVVVVLPVYNEALHLPGLLRQIDAVMRREGLGFQIIAVDDGSSDETPLILDEQTRKFPLTVHRHATNQGLGSTIRDGLRAAVAAASDHDVVVTMDADETHLPELIPGMARMVREGCDVVIASRYQPGSAVVGLSLRRRILSGCASLM